MVKVVVTLISINADLEFVSSPIEMNDEQLKDLIFKSKNAGYNMELDLESGEKLMMTAEQRRNFVTIVKKLED